MAYPGDPTGPSKLSKIHLIPGSLKISWEYHGHTFFLLFPIFALIPCSPIDGAARIYLLFSLHPGIARSRLRVWFHFSYHLRPRGRKIIWILQLDPNMPLVGIEPGPPAQQARALSITLLPPGIGVIPKIRLESDHQALIFGVMQVVDKLQPGGTKVNICWVVPINGPPL